MMKFSRILFAAALATAISLASPQIASAKHGKSAAKRHAAALRHKKHKAKGAKKHRKHVAHKHQVSKRAKKLARHKKAAHHSATTRVSPK